MRVRERDKQTDKKIQEWSKFGTRVSGYITTSVAMTITHNFLLQHTHAHESVKKQTFC